jgi:sulfoxide reductase heme-binding subunit YedZ
LLDIPKRPFILVGLLALMLLLPLALTSFNAAIRWLGAARWRNLHRAVYGIAVLAILHFFWMRAGKRNFDQVALYAAIVGLLLAWRLRRFFTQRGARP